MKAKTKAKTYEVMSYNNQPDILYFFVTGIKPKAKERPRLTRYGGVYTPKPTTDAERELKNIILSLREGEPPMANEITVEVSFFFAHPKTVIGKDRQRCKIHHDTPDIDNLVKLFMDALNGTLYNDDKQVFYLLAEKYYAPYDGIQATIRNIEEL